MHAVPSRRTGFALAAALVLAAAGLVAAPAASALAPGLDPDNRLGDLILDKTGGDISVTGGPQRLTTATGCPEGYRNSTRVFFIWSDGTWNLTQVPALAYVLQTNVTGSGLSGEPIDRVNLTTVSTGQYASRWAGGGFSPNNFDGHSGAATYLVTCDAGATPSNTLPATAGGVGSAKYFSVDLNLTWDDAENTGTWSVAAEAPDDRTTTSTVLAASPTSPTSVTLSASVSPSEATGTVTFTNGGTVLGDPVTVTDGAASVQVSGLSPETAYTLTAQYSGDETHAPSSGSASVTTPAVVVADTSTSAVTVDVPVATSEPQEPTGLKISVEPGAVTLAGPAERAEGQSWTATGQLGDVTVNDDRQDATSGAWTLNGTSSAFSSGSATIAASNLGWTPSKVGGSGSAGAAATDLSSDKPLASGAASADPNVTTTVGAGLSLVVPATAADGAYTATLTLTLI